MAQYLKPFSEQDALPSFADVAQLMGLDGRYLPHRPQIFPNGEMDSILVPAIPQLRNVRFRPTPPKDFNIPKTNLILQTVRMEKRIGAISERTRLGMYCFTTLINFVIDTELGDVIIHTPENALQAAIALIASRAGCVGFHMSALQVLCEAVQFKIRSLCLDLNSISDGCKVSDSDELIKFVSALLSVKLLDAPHPEEALTSLAQHYQEVEVNPFLEMKTEYESVSSSKRTRRSTGSMNS